MWITLLTNYKKIIFVTLIALVLGLSGSLYLTKNKLKSTFDMYSVEANNVKALEQGVLHWKDVAGRNNSKSIQLQYKTEYLERSNDSTVRYLNNIIKDQKIKIKNISQMGYITSSVDTILQDTTIYINTPDTTVDLSDEYIKNIVRIKKGYISSEIGVVDTLGIFFTNRKELIAPKKKFFICRWFQNWFGDKQTIVEAQVTRSNKRVQTTDQKFIHIIK